MKKSFLPLLLVFLAACSKRSGADKDYDAPVITLNTPVNNQHFIPGQAISVTGTVSDNKYIKVIHVVITNFDTGVEYMHVHISPATSSASFDQSLTTQAGINYQVEIIAEDPSANISSKKAEVSAN
jgi:uncharacterized protein DUF4625